MRALLETHLNREIGINVERPLHLETATLTAVHEEFFSVHCDETGNTYHIPYNNICKAIEHAGGVKVGRVFQQRRAYELVIKIGHVVDYLPT